MLAVDSVYTIIMQCLTNSKAAFSSSATEVTEAAAAEVAEPSQAAPTASPPSSGPGPTNNQMVSTSKLF